MQVQLIVKPNGQNTKSVCPRFIVPSDIVGQEQIAAHHSKTQALVEGQRGRILAPNAYPLKPQWKICINPSSLMAFMEV